MTLTDLTLVFALSLLASMHCAQMCGPIVLSFTLSSSASPFRSALAYNAGRILTYTTLGAAAGLLGKTLSPFGRLLGVEDTAAIVGGGLMLVAGLVMFGALRRPKLIQIAPVRKAGQLLRRPGLRAKFSMGALMGFLPCGLIYAALFKSLGAGSAVLGGANMLAFGLGTAAPLLALGTFSATLLRWFGRYSAPLAACGVSCMGLALLWRGLRPICVAHLSL